ncbi:MAG TPA: FliM/FliN family flagellar motor switch protein [Povalibacter sp.]|uniref:FliM/FliN family flagellar motor switch protein n=1 Tax=Povalibacter sp. TaxID=1962978 RepID=UPI002CC6D3C3|nr:FliM/FliN family flagellar motor switch protein [Povalibacter sp.]HMN43159.1 FliM/FliN family flagellar motor switch protein [Povalibacter sp.]
MNLTDAPLPDNRPDNLPDNLLTDLPDPLDEAVVAPPAPPVAPPRRDFAQMMRRIPVTLTLEVGSTRLSLQELAAIEPNSVIELDTLAGQPLIIKVNGTPIGRAEVVVSGENYGLKVLELSDLDLGSLT